MLRFLLTRLLRVIAILLGATLITFLLLHTIPGSPWDNYSDTPRAMQSIGLDKASQQELARRFGLNLPLWRQFTRYVIGDVDPETGLFCGAICGNLGPSTRQRGRAVQDILFATPEGKTLWDSRFGYSIRLVLLASLFAVGLGIPLGIISAARPRSRLGNAISLGLATLISIPSFVLGLLAIIVLASWLQLINVIPDWSQPGHWIVPAIILGTMPMASIARVARASLMNILSEDYIRTARGKGLMETRVMLVHVLRNALVPIMTFLGPTCVEMFTGLFVVESLYPFPGFGREYWEAILALDYPMIMGLTLVYAVGIALVNVLVELLGEILDPRIRLIKQRGAA